MKIIIAYHSLDPLEFHHHHMHIHRFYKVTAMQPEACIEIKNALLSLSLSLPLLPFCTHLSPHLKFPINIPPDDDDDDARVFGGEEDASAREGKNIKTE